jgi:hypothetical protein
MNGTSYNSHRLIQLNYSLFGFITFDQTFSFKGVVLQINPEIRIILGSEMSFIRQRPRDGDQGTTVTASIEVLINDQRFQKNCKLLSIVDIYYYLMLVTKKLEV